jgi:uncharacterized protein (TIGR03435 family)
MYKSLLSRIGLSGIRLSGIGAGLLLVAGAAFAQTPAPALAFEVASVKPAGPPDPARMMSGRMGMKVDGARVDIGFLSLTDLIGIAYRVKPYQISGPDWMSAQRFDIMAKLPAGASQDQAPEMLQALLAERFKLTIHRANKEIQIYALVVGKNGPKLKESPPDQPAAPAADGAAPSTDTSLRISGDPQKGMTVSNGLGSGTVKITMANGAMHMESAKMSMTQFAEALSRFLDHPVVDMTDLKGNYQVALDLSMEDIMNAARSAGMQGPGGPGRGGGGMPGRGAAEGASDPSGSSLFNNVQQLGLKLEARKAPADLIVVDHLEKLPTEN